MAHVRGAPYHPMTQGKIERWHQTLKNRILLENYYLPGDLEAQIAPGRGRMVTTETYAARRMVMSRRARLRWRRSLELATGVSRAGGRA
jgi:transposase InsO family protein